MLDGIVSNVLFWSRQKQQSDSLSQKKIKRKNIKVKLCPQLKVTTCYACNTQNMIKTGQRDFMWELLIKAKQLKKLHPTW